MNTSKGNGKNVSVLVLDFWKTMQEGFDMELIAGKTGLDHKRILEAAINRPGLALTGFYDNFSWKRIQMFGLAENAYLSSLNKKEREKSLDDFFASKIPCLIIARNKKVFPEVIALADKYETPVFRSKMITKHLINGATIIMENMMAPRVKIQGTMVEFMGVGVLIEGRPGIGKSETALSLIRKGAALVADDITAIRVDSAGSIIGSAVNVTRYHMEIKGIGIIHVPSLFGVASVRGEKKLDLIVSLCRQGEVDDAELRVEYTNRVRELLGVRIPNVMISVRPGRDIANIVEVAALNHKLLSLGHDAAKELDHKLMDLMAGGKDVSE